MDKPTPIIILGSARCGTTSLANHLCEHPAIAGVQAEEHWGIKECPFLCTWRHYLGEISEPEELVSVLEVFSEGDYFRGTGIEKKVIYEDQPDNWGDLIRKLMNEYARRNGARYWLIKSPRQTMYVDELQKAFPEARFILIRRNLFDVVRSNVKREGTDRGFIEIGKRVFRYQSDFRSVDAWKHKLEHFQEVDFNAFVNRTEQTLRDVLEFLDLPWNESVLHNPYKIDSSFQGGDEEKHEFFSVFDQFKLWIWAGILQVVPSSIIKIFRRKWDAERVERKDVHPLYFRLHPEAHRFSGEEFHREDRSLNDVRERETEAS